MNGERRALVICAHDDDEVIGSGGTIRKLANAGVRVTTVVFATGNEGYLRIEEKDTYYFHQLIVRKSKSAGNGWWGSTYFTRSRRAITV